MLGVRIKTHINKYIPGGKRSERASKEKQNMSGFIFFFLLLLFTKLARDGFISHMGVLFYSQGMIEVWF